MPKAKSPRCPVCDRLGKTDVKHNGRRFCCKLHRTAYITHERRKAEQRKRRALVRRNRELNEVRVDYGFLAVTDDFGERVVVGNNSNYCPMG